MIFLKKILVTTDLSPFSLAALEYATSFGTLYTSKIYLLYVMEGKEGAHGKETHSQPKTEEEAARALEGFVRTNIPSETRLVQVVRKGVPADEIKGFAQEEGIDLIVMASHGRTGVRHMLMGSVAERVVRHCNVPVLTVKPHPFRETIIQREDVETELRLR
jgi:nucleotide-binding universal stress UspA family protein